MQNLHIGHCCAVKFAKEFLYLQFLNKLIK